MSSLLASTRRIVLALVGIALVAGLCVAGWGAWQDYTYASALQQAHDDTEMAWQQEINEQPRTESPACLRSRMRSVSEWILVTDAMFSRSWVPASRIIRDRVSRVKPTRRWREFDALVETRHDLIVNLAEAASAADERALGVVLALPRGTSSRDAVNELADDKEFRRLEAEASQLLGELRDVEGRLDNAVPDHYWRAKSIKQERYDTTSTRVTDLGRHFEVATKPSLVAAERRPIASAIGETDESASSAQRQRCADGSTIGSTQTMPSDPTRAPAGAPTS